MKRRVLTSIGLMAVNLVVAALSLFAQGTNSPAVGAAGPLAACGYAAYAGPQVSDDEMLQRFADCPCLQTFVVPNCSYVVYVDVIDSTTGQIMEIYGAGDFFSSRGGIVRSGLVTSGASARGSAVRDAYAEQERSRLWVRETGTGKTIYLCSNYYNAFRLKVWHMDPSTCAWTSSYVSSSGPCPSARDLDNCQRVYFGNVIIWMALDSRVLAGMGADDVYHEIYRALAPSYTIDGRFTNESLAGLAVTASPTSTGSTWYVELRIRTERCTSEVLAKIQSILTRYGLRATITGRQLRISSS